MLGGVFESEAGVEHVVGEEAQICKGPGGQVVALGVVGDAQTLYFPSGVGLGHGDQALDPLTLELVSGGPLLIENCSNDEQVFL